MFDVEPPPSGEPIPETLSARMEALTGLYEAVIAEFAHHPGPPFLAPDRALSPTAIGKALLRSAGLTSPLARRPREPRRALGAAMAAYVGPRSEVRARRVPLPVAYLDAHSMFLLVDGLLHNSELLTHRVEARRLTRTRELASLNGRLGALDPDVLLAEAEAWPSLRGVALIEPAWDIQPGKARYSASSEETTTVSPVASAAGPIWSAYPDLLVSKSETGRLPRILEAWEWKPAERLPGLGSARLPDGTVIDLAGQQAAGPRVWHDAFLAFAAARLRTADNTSLSDAARERRRGMLKAEGNGIGYGAEIEFNRRCRPCEHTVWAPHGRTRVHVLPEHPGWLCYPPFATFTVAGSRLMIALLVRLVGESGGTVVWIDTDGACIVATESGRLIPCPGGRYRDDRGRDCVRALSYDEVQKIRARFTRLVDAIGYPQTGDPSGVRSVFKLEQHNLDEQGLFAPGLECYAVSVKNYVLFRRDPAGNPIAEPRSKFSAHAMGNLVSPLDPETNDPSWIPEAWLWWLARDEGRHQPEPAFLDLPVTHAMVVAHSDDFRLIRNLNRGKSYDHGIKPFDTLLLAHLDRFLLAEGSPRRLLALWEPD
jgi:hypothetical protein